MDLPARWPSRVPPHEPAAAGPGRRRCPGFISGEPAGHRRRQAASSEAPRIVSADAFRAVLAVALRDRAVDLHSRDGHWKAVVGRDHRHLLAGHFDGHFRPRGRAAAQRRRVPRVQVKVPDGDLLAPNLPVRPSPALWPTFRSTVRTSGVRVEGGGAAAVRTGTRREKTARGQRRDIGTVPGSSARSFGTAPDTANRLRRGRPPGRIAHTAVQPPRRSGLPIDRELTAQNDNSSGRGLVDAPSDCASADSPRHTGFVDRSGSRRRPGTKARGAGARRGGKAEDGRPGRSGQSPSYSLPGRRPGRRGRRTTSAVPARLGRRGGEACGRSCPGRPIVVATGRGATGCYFIVLRNSSKLCGLSSGQDLHRAS